MHDPTKKASRKLVVRDSKGNIVTCPNCGEMYNIRQRSVMPESYQCQECQTEIRVDE
jgi:predicted RNA-binding Zn-ribbon protein involved in translation (DUF1610 family)